MPKRTRVKEKRLTPKEFEDALVDFEKSPPDIVDEKELRKRLKATTLTRYQRGTALLDEVKKAIITSNAGSTTKKDLKIAVARIDEAIVQMTHGSLKYNKGATAEGIRTLVQVTRTGSRAKKTR
jgi:hypothetical protein